MIEPGDEPERHPQRDQTDESLQAERDTADSRVEDKQDEVEERADEVVRVARARADQITRADTTVVDERAVADALLEHERAERRRYLADFLELERDATDADLIGERVHADIAIAARDEFLASVSHDLRSLLGGLSLNSQLLFGLGAEGAGGDAIRKAASRSQRMVTRMSRLINDLLDVTSIEAGRLALHPDLIGVAEILHDTIEGFEPIAAAKFVTLSAESVPTPLQVKLDGHRILQVLANLVSNAIKFTPAGGDVSIRTRIDGDRLQFSVCDNGSGIPESELATVFERFRQVNPDRRGLGLGLHISKGIVEAHGGTLWAESTLGEGSTFHFSLPVGIS